MASDATLGVITEQGDLGLGFKPVTESEQKTVQQNDELKKENQNK